MRLFALLVIVASFGLLAAQEKPKVTMPPAKGHGHGRVVIHERDKLRKLPNPQAKPHGMPPAHKHEGHHWRWHRSYGWVLVPATVSPSAVVLPETYALPAQVMMYEEGAAAGCRCPHCGKAIVLTPG